MKQGPRERPLFCSESSGSPKNVNVWHRVGSSSPPDTQNAPLGCGTSQVLGGIVRPIHGPHPSALCAPGPAFGCPNSLPANSSNRVGSSAPPSPPDTQNAPNGAFCVSGGEGGIRTHGTLTRTPDFESGTFDHSATSPVGCMVAHASRESYASAGIVTTTRACGMLRRLALTRAP